MCKEKTCCFIGHREIEEKERLSKKLTEIIENLILKENVTKFIFGSKSRFDTLCYEIVTKLKERYPYIERVYIRAEFSEIGDKYKAYLLEKYEDTYFSQKAFGKASYIERNKEMIEKSDFCIIYFKEDLLKPYKSGTKIAFDYAIKKNKKIVRML